MEEQKKIFYTGIGCNRTTIHTETEFLEIMRKKIVAEKIWEYELTLSNGWFLDYFFGKQTFKCIDHGCLQYKHFNLPDDFEKFTLDDWLDYSGAIMDE
jgi:hypothetical protein